MQSHSTCGRLPLVEDCGRDRIPRRYARPPNPHRRGTTRPGPHSPRNARVRDFELHSNDARPGTATSVLFTPETANVRVRAHSRVPIKPIECATQERLCSPAIFALPWPGDCP